MNKNYLLLEFPSKETNEGIAKKAISEFAMQLDPTTEELEDIKLAVQEAVDNAVIHAYPQGCGPITIRCRILKGNTLDITIKDAGVGIADVEQARTPMYTSCPDCSGMGFTVMESFMTSCEVKSVVGKGTTVTLKKRIAPRK